MRKTTKRTKKKPTSKPNIPAPPPTVIEYTPMQIEQAALGKQLDAYITEFQQKLLKLNFAPSDRELIVLFIMNLHPRFKRFVEPVELSYSNWIEAAAFAKHHCTRISAILGCERHDADPMFKTPEAKALMSSGYFVPASSPAAGMFPGADAIRHLLMTDKVISMDSSATNSASSSVIITKDDESNKEMDNSNEETQDEIICNSKLADAESSISNKVTETVTTESDGSSRKEPEETAIAFTDRKQAESQTDIVESKKLTDTLESKKPIDTVKSKEPTDTVESKEPTDKESKKATETATKSPVEPKKPMEAEPNNKSLEIESKEPAEVNKKSTQVTTTKEGQYSVSSPMTKTEVQARIQQAVKAKKEKEKKFSLPRTTIIESKPNKHSICYRVPDEHANINLTFLELTINNQKVKGLLAKVRWGSSAMSSEAVKRLGLVMRESNYFCIHTDFGYEDTIGIIKLPIVHPADATLTSDMEIQVLPKIYNGKIDLVLGADFFYFFQPTLNIKTRAIRFLGKETPYIVDKIEA